MTNFRNNILQTICKKLKATLKDLHMYIETNLKGNIQMQLLNKLTPQ